MISIVLPALWGVRILLLELLSETTVEKDRIINQGMHEVSAPTGDRTTALREEYSLSDNGETLILRANRSAPKGEMSSTMVFRRAEASK